MKWSTKWLVIHCILYFITWVDLDAGSPGLCCCTLCNLHIINFFVLHLSKTAWEREREQFQLICYLWLLMYNWVFRSLDGLHRLFVVVNVWLSVLDGLQWLVHWVPRLKGELIYLAGVKHVAGDMFESIPKGDAILLMVSFDFWVCWVFFPDFLWSYAFSFLFFFWNLVLVLMT